eukprot:TRINITY_DN10287_c0_g1_i2.p1 TRINITY_DN10287_c0_g1~~TRINITY_DN10287_c0_g1_i2.p1  ORF type:complete len:314 (+),score=23.40 TRINITY_DN10287_c0_g1_i2:108-1049(+)
MLVYFVCFGLFSMMVSQQEECDNNPYYVYQEQLPHRDVYQMLSNTTYRDEALYTPKFSYDRFFIYYIKPKNGKNFIICTTPKSGHSRIKLLLIRMLTNSSKYGDFKGYEKFNPVEWLPPSTLKEILNDKNIPRFIVVRDPYIRALSMYKNQAKKLKENLGFTTKKDLKWQSFVESIYNRLFMLKLDVNSEHVDRHFQPQSTICRIDQGMTYNYVLKQEQINDWFDCFIDAVGGREAAMHGWWNYDQCYFSTMKTPCNGPYLKDGVLQQVDKRTQKHNTGSALQLDLFYANKTLARMIAEIYQEDIINFNYQFI